jgi:hypothetical protein
MSLPPLVYYKTEEEYKDHYEREYCQGAIFSFDGIRVYFKPESFQHAFYESSQRNGVKDVFSEVRSQRINWIKETLENINSDLYQGWNKWKESYEPNKRVQIVYEDFVVIIRLKLDRRGNLKGQFMTCYLADNSIEKIRMSPKWTWEECMAILKEH